MKKIQLIAIALLLAFSSACQNKTEEMKKYSIMDDEKDSEFEWEEMCNAPLGYPIEVYKGGIGGVGLANGLSGGNEGGWGASSGGSSHGKKTLPRTLDCIWVSYAEDCMYSIDCPIDYDKLLALFQEGYQDSNRKFGYKKRTYSAIIVGFAPGGVVVVWAAGAGRQVEIGRYKGTPYKAPKDEIAGLDASGETIFDPKFRKMIMTSPNIIPLEMQNNPQPIPYGLWDSYRTLYNWKPVVETLSEGIVHRISFDMYNGEKERLFDQELIANNFKKRAVPNGFAIGWKDTKGQVYGGVINFDEKEVIAAFKAMYKESPEQEAELVLIINYTNNHITSLLRRGDKEIRLSKSAVNIFKTSE